MKKKNTAVLLTGASSGIGAEIVKVFTGNNVNVIGVSRKYGKLKSILKSPDERKNRFYPYKLDVGNLVELKKVFAGIKRKHRISTLINNAGITAFKSAINHTDKEVENIIRVNLLGAIYSTKAVLPEMLKNNEGTIINILSVAAKNVFANSSVYSASKAGLLAFMNVLREEIKHSNIRIINILPGATATPIWPGEALDRFGDKMMTAEDVAKFIFEIYNLRSSVVPEEIIIRPVHGDL